MKKSVLFVIPTLFTDPAEVDDCATSLAENLRNFDVDYKICVVINFPSAQFDSYKFAVPVTKMCGHLQFNIARALNTAYKNYPNFDYFCFFDEGIRISNKKWVDLAISLFEANQKTGLLGCRPHSSFDFYNKKVSDDPLLYEVLWSDGVLLTHADTLKTFNGFDESYFAECELQDFGYRLHAAGYINYYWRGLADSHKLVKFEKKHPNKSELLGLRKNSRKLFHDRWTDFEKRHNFQTITELAKLSK